MRYSNLLSPTNPITTYSQFVAGIRWRERLRRSIRNSGIYALSSWREVPRHLNWIRFLNYHHVFDDERDGFAVQLKYLRNIGEFISLDEVVSYLASEQTLDGRYFCITFDDGFKNCLTNATPILLDYHASAAFFISTYFIDTSLEPLGKGLPSLENHLYSDGKPLVEFLTWDDCRQMTEAGMTIGSHTVNHRQLINLSEREVEHELSKSKAVIEDELEVPCNHFSCPWGLPGRDFNPDREPAIACRIGYSSFLTSRRGTVQRQPSPMMIDRDHVIANWGTYQLRYLLSR